MIGLVEAQQWVEVPPGLGNMRARSPKTTGAETSVSAPDTRCRPTVLGSMTTTTGSCTGASDSRWGLGRWGDVNEA